MPFENQTRSWRIDLSTGTEPCTNLSKLDSDQGAALEPFRNQMGTQEKRERPITLQSRVSETEAAAIRTMADRAGLSVSALTRHALLNQKPPRAAGQPPINRQAISRLIGKLGSLAQALREATDTADQSAISAQIEASHRDISDMCFAFLKALGKRP